MCVPILRLWQSLVNAVIEIFVVGEDNVAADIVELGSILAIISTIRSHHTYKAFWGDICGGKTTRCLVGVNDHP